MGLIAAAILTALAIYLLGRNNPQFKGFCNNYGGVLIFLLAAWQLINFETAMDGGRRSPSFLPAYLLIGFSIRYRMDLFKLLGLRRAYPDEQQGWKFMTTLSTGILLPSLYFSIQNTLIAAPVAVLIWFFLFFVTVEAQKTRALSYFSPRKLWLPMSIGLISFGLYFWAVN